MVSTIANDGVWVAPRIIAGTTEPQGTPQMVAFHPGVQRRVISTMTAAQMKQMMQGVVLHGTGKKAILEGYSSAGKTGTAQKVDPSTRTYSRTKYVASFAGFAPINDPSITVAVILDSAVGLHQGGQVSAPVFQRVAQQVLEYLHTPHDVELPPSRQVLLAERESKNRTSKKDRPTAWGTLWKLPMPVHQKLHRQPAEPRAATACSFRQAGAGHDCQRSGACGLAGSTRRLLYRGGGPKSARRRGEPQGRKAGQEEGEPPSQVHLPSSGTVVLEVEQGGILVPSFLGKSVRSAIEMAQENGLDLDAVGNGLAREQSPPPGSHVASGSSVTVKFGER